MVFYVQHKTAQIYGETVHEKLMQQLKQSIVKKDSLAFFKFCLILNLWYYTCFVEAWKLLEQHWSALPGHLQCAQELHMCKIPGSRAKL